MSAEKSQGKKEKKFGLTRREALHTALKAGAGAALLTFLGRTAAGAEQAVKAIAAGDSAPAGAPKADTRAAQMQCRPFGKKIDWKVSALGMGCMRLPTKDGVPQTPDIDMAAFTKMLHSAIEQGLNYVDTAWPYHEEESEPAVGKALRGPWRDKVKLATKSPIWLIESPADFDKYLNAQLKKLQTDHIDCYVLHALNSETWETVKKFNLVEKAAAAKKDGKIRHIGFSFHDKYEIYKEILNFTDKWEFCMLQYNYMDIDYQAGMKGVKEAAAKGLGVIAMEPLLGGKLANPPAPVKAIMDGAAVKRSPVGWAFDWIWSQPEISMVLSGMSSPEQMEENLGLARKAGLSPFTADDLKIIELVRKKFDERKAIPCTTCGYCMPCPFGVNIPKNFNAYNDYAIYDDLKGARAKYRWRIKENERAAKCVQCHACEKKCPQHIKISEWMPKVNEQLAWRS
jgi:predicted aldo/keto reductase-like oxidoreductase